MAELGELSAKLSEIKAKIESDLTEIKSSKGVFAWIQRKVRSDLS